MSKVAIIKTGVANVGSVQNMLTRLGVMADITDDPATILQATKLILPGVGAFDRGMHYLKQKNLIAPLQEKVLLQKTPILGICLGMQLFAEKSEEGILPGLGWLKAELKRFNLEGIKPVPHMGWNELQLAAENFLFSHYEDCPRFYFAHSYHYVALDQNLIIANCDYGYVFPAAIQKDNIYGVQFHPEKSHRYGLKLLENFLKI